MGIPETQLEIWSHQGAVAGSRDTYATIRHALEASDSAYAAKDYRVFLQGSYGNDTNIYRESDVDVVIQLDSIFYHDLTEMPQVQQEGFRAAYGSDPYTYSDFRRDVVAQLRGTFGDATQPGAKAILIEAEGNRRKADVIVATQFRRYHRFLSMGDQQYDLGICLFMADGTRIANYPRQHSTNCTAKHKATDGWFKPTVRVLKNLRGRLVDKKLIADGLAPSYFIEGLLYNVPNDQFGGTYEDTFVNAINWIKDADRSKFVCANEQYYLLRDVAHVCWSPGKCDELLAAVTQLWKDW